VQIPFAATIGGVPFSCRAAAGGFTPTDLRFYVHGIELLDRTGKAVAVRLDSDGIWQEEVVALLDFENGEDHCSDGTPGTNTVIRGRVPAAEYRGLRFLVGVPFALNHADPASAAAPLNLGRMHWGWQAGYKFLRFEGAMAGSAFRLHLGSTGCEGTVGHITGCARPNRVLVDLPAFRPQQSQVRLELGELPRQAPGSCMAETDQPSCRAAFALLGLSLASGVPSGTQSLFSAQLL
jgi:uncharacterized repeat protein (TIGR04052 family)